MDKPAKSMAQWAQVVREAGITDYHAAAKWLREQHGLTANYAMGAASIATLEGGFKDYGDEAGMLAAMYSGPKEHLRPLYDKLWGMAQRLGPDVELAVCKTQVSFRRAFQFAIVTPTNRTTVDLGLALPKETQPGGRLERDPKRDSGDRVQWRVRLQSSGDIDKEVAAWLKQAYAHADRKRK